MKKRAIIITFLSLTLCGFYANSTQLSKAEQERTDNEELLNLAEKGDIEAQYRLGKQYYTGLHREQNLKEAYKWLGKAAQEGNSLAELSYGTMYEMGDYVDIDKNKAIYWYNKSCEQMNAEACFYAGGFYKNGEIGSPDYMLAASKFENAIQNSNSSAFVDAARLELGKMYRDGLGVKKDTPKAIELFTEACPMEREACSALRELK